MSAPYPPQPGPGGPWVQPAPPPPGYPGGPPPPQQPVVGPYPPQPPPGSVPHQGGGPYPQPSGQGWLALTTRFLPLAWLLYFFKPRVLIDGFELRPPWGQQMIPVPAGPHQVHVHVPYFMPKRFGPADSSVVVYPGQTVPMEYRAPLWTYSRGSLGPPPQPYNGVVPFVLLMLLAVGVIVLNIALAAS